MLLLIFLMYLFLFADEEEAVRKAILRCVLPGGKAFEDEPETDEIEDE